MGQEESKTRHGVLPSLDHTKCHDHVSTSKRREVQLRLLSLLFWELLQSKEEKMLIMVLISYKVYIELRVYEIFFTIVKKWEIKMAHWRDSARNVRLFFLDFRACFPLLILLFHIRWWTFILAVVATIFFTILERYGFTLTVFLRWLRAFVAGPRKIAQPWWKR